MATFSTQLAETQKEVNILAQENKYFDVHYIALLQEYFIWNIKTNKDTIQKNMLAEARKGVNQISLQMEATWLTKTHHVNTAWFNIQKQVSEILEVPVRLTNSHCGTSFYISFHPPAQPVSAANSTFVGYS